MINILGTTPYPTEQGFGNANNKSAPDPTAAAAQGVNGALPQGEIPDAGSASRGEAPGKDGYGKQNGMKDGKQNGMKDGRKDGKRNFDSLECETCKNRKYQDGSDDPGVSFKTPKAVDPKAAATAVRSHENEHVVREQASARRENRKVVSQSVTYHSAICPECGTSYISGGTTRTVTKGQVEKTYRPEQEKVGEQLDAMA